MSTERLLLAWADFARYGERSAVSTCFYSSEPPDQIPPRAAIAMRSPSTLIPQLSTTGLGIITFVPRARKKRLRRGCFAPRVGAVVIVFGVPVADLQL